MAIILNNQRPIGDVIAQGFGTGVGTGVQHLLEQKIASMKRQEQMGRYGAALKHLGLPQELAALDADLLKPLITEHAKAKYKEPSQKAFADIARQLVGGGQQAPGQGAQQQRPTQSQDDIINDLLSREEGFSPKEMEDALATVEDQPISNEITNAAQGGEITPSKQQVNIPEGTELSQHGLEKIIDINQKNQEREFKERSHQEKEAREGRKEERTKNKAAREYLAPYNERAEKAELNIPDYKNLIKLAPHLRSGTKYQILKKFGVQDLWRPQENELAEKLIARLSQNVSGVFGRNSRITNFLEQTFQRSLPTLWNTPEGIAAIAELNMLADEGNIIRKNEANKLVRKYKGELPPDIDDQVSAASRSQIEELEKRGSEIIDKLIGSGNEPVVEETFKALPKASEYPNRSIRDNRTGKTLRSNGTRWLEAK